MSQALWRHGEVQYTRSHAVQISDENVTMISDRVQRQLLLGLIFFVLVAMLGVASQRIKVLRSISTAADFVIHSMLPHCGAAYSDVCRTCFQSLGCVLARVVCTIVGLWRQGCSASGFAPEARSLASFGLDRDNGYRRM
jgi:hypothetical protein